MFIYRNLTLSTFSSMLSFLRVHFDVHYSSDHLLRRIHEHYMNSPYRSSEGWDDWLELNGSDWTFDYDVLQDSDANLIQGALPGVTQRYCADFNGYTRNGTGTSQVLLETPDARGETGAAWASSMLRSNRETDRALPHQASSFPPGLLSANCTQIPENTINPPREHNAASSGFTLFDAPTPPRTDPPNVDGETLHEGKPRFEGDLYTPRWIRGEGANREGWCGFCSSWYKRKDSAYVSWSISTFCTTLD